MMNPAIIFATDGGDYNRLLMSIFSARKFMGSLDIFVLTDNSDLTPIEGVQIINPVPALSTAGFHSNGWNRKWPFATLFRMAIPLLPELNNYDRILYLDTDVLVRSADVATLFAMDLGDKEAYAVSDCEARQWRISNVMAGDLCAEAKSAMAFWLWDRAGTVANSYANAGVTLWNLRRIRQNGVEWYRQRLRWFWEAECRGKFRFLDQDFMNVMMETSPSLNKRFNWFGGDKDTNCIIQHFVAGTKGAMEPTANHMGWNS